MDQVLERIAAWEEAGLIDPATAARLRLHEAERPPEPAEQAMPAVAADSIVNSGPRPPSSIASVFGPGVTIGEMFAYLGGAFLLAAFETFVVRTAGFRDESELLYAIAWTVAAIATGVVGMILRTGDARRQRAAGVMFVLAVAHAGAAGTALAGAAGLEWPAIGVLGAGVAMLAAIAFRLVHPALLTQVALLASITSFAALALDWLDQIAFRDSLDAGSAGSPDPIVRVVISAAWWLGLAVLIGLIGLREADGADDGDSAGDRRAALTRLWAGLVAVIGLSTAVTTTTFTADGTALRVVEPWIGQLAILVLSAILVERAFRRDASTFVYAAALGLIIALSDFNFSYLASSTELGLLIEGIILLGAGVGADRLRRRIERPEAEDDVEVSAPAEPA